MFGFHGNLIVIFGPTWNTANKEISVFRTSCSFRTLFVELLQIRFAPRTVCLSFALFLDLFDSHWGEEVGVLLWLDSPNLKNQGTCENRGPLKNIFGFSAGFNLDTSLKWVAGQKAHPNTHYLKQGGEYPEAIYPFACLPVDLRDNGTLKASQMGNNALYLPQSQPEKAGSLKKHRSPIPQTPPNKTEKKEQQCGGCPQPESQPGKGHLPPDSRATGEAF